MPIFWLTSSLKILSVLVVVCAASSDLPVAAENVGVLEESPKSAKNDGVHTFKLMSQSLENFSGVRPGLQGLLEEGAWAGKVQKGTEKLYNSQNTVFYADIAIGTPEQKFEVVIDTGSFILWVPDRVCKLSSSPCRNHHTFDLADSSSGKVLGKVVKNGKTYLKIGRLQYGTGNMQGVEIEDTVHIAGLEIPKVGMLTATTVATQPFRTAPFDGILGVGRGSEIVDGVQFNVLQTTYKKKLIPKNIIAFYFTDTPTDASHAAGAVTIGGVKESLYQGQMRWHPVAEFGVPMWTIPIESLSVGDGVNVCEGGCVGVVDTGTSLIVSDGDRVGQLVKDLGISQDCSNYDSLPDVKFEFGGHHHVYKLPGHAVAIKQVDAQGDKMCGAMINTMGGPTEEAEVAPLVEDGGVMEQSQANVDEVVPEAGARKLLGSGSPAPPENSGDYGKPAPLSENPGWDKITAMYGGKPVVIVGDLFMRKHYVAFDNTDPKKARVGIATRKSLSADELDQVVTA